MYANEKISFILPINEVEQAPEDFLEREATSTLFLQVCEELVRRFPAAVEKYVIKKDQRSLADDVTLCEVLAVIESPATDSFLHISVSWFMDGEVEDGIDTLSDDASFVLVIEEFDDVGLFVQEYQYTHLTSEQTVYRRDLGPEVFDQGSEKELFCMIGNIRFAVEIEVAQKSERPEDREEAAEYLKGFEKYTEDSSLAKSIGIDIRPIRTAEVFGLMALLNDALPYEEGELSD